jgi:hypothetical protein
MKSKLYWFCKCYHVYSLCAVISMLFVPSLVFESLARFWNQIQDI